MKRIGTTIALTGLGLSLALAGCSTAGSGEADAPVTVWTLESQPERVKALESIAADFTTKAGTKVEVVAVDEDQYNQLLTSSAASGELPDVIAGLDLVGVGALSANELLDADAAASVVEGLGQDTFVPESLTRASIDGKVAAVPSDSWTSVLLYRKDLFQQAGLKAPTDQASILAAAKQLNGKGRVGFSGFTTNHETFEHFALGSDCELVDELGSITMNSPQCVDSFDFYNQLIGDYSVKGEQDPNSVRANYLAGRTAMAVYSSFILDEVAGLRKDLAPTCPQCKADPEFLVKNTGVVTSVTGPGGATGQYGKQTNFVIPVDASEQADDFVSYMMSDGYERWLALAPEGKVPNRRGTSDDPTRYVKAWQAMESGLDTRAPLSDFYPQQVIDDVASSPTAIQEWGIEQGQAPLMGALLGEDPVTKAMTDMFNGRITPAQAAEQASSDIQAIQDSLR